MKGGSFILSRSQFIDFMSNQDPAKLQSTRGQPEGVLQDGAVTVLFEPSAAKHGELFAFSVAQESMMDFFAFTSTYISNYWPFSAYFRVIPTERIKHIESLQPLDDRIAQRFAHLITGASIAEQSTRMRLQKNLRFTSNVNSLKSSLSYVLGSAVMSGYKDNSLFALANDWVGVASTSIIEADRLRSFELAEVWQTLAAAGSFKSILNIKNSEKNARAIQSFLSEALVEGRVDAKNLGKLNHQISPAIDLSSTLLSSREERIRRLNDHISTMDGAHDKFVGSFIAGLLLAIAGNGSFDMLQSSDRLLERSPQGVIWFGVCASLFQESNVLTYSNCLGRRFARDIYPKANLFSPFRCDCGIDEFELIKEDPVALSRLVSGVGDQPIVELAPGIVTQAFIVSSKGGEKFVETFDLLSESVKEMQFVIERTQRRMARLAGPQQRELFRAEDKTRGRKR